MPQQALHSLEISFLAIGEVAVLGVEKVLFGFSSVVFSR
jgi:hypothetical protein